MFNLEGGKEHPCSFALGRQGPLPLTHCRLSAGSLGWPNSSSSPVTLCCSFFHLWALGVYILPWWGAPASAGHAPRGSWSLRGKMERPTWDPAWPHGSQVALASSTLWPSSHSDRGLEAPAPDTEGTAHLDGNRLPQLHKVVLLFLDS